MIKLVFYYDKLVIFNLYNNNIYYGHRKPYEYDFCVCASAPTAAFVGVVCCNKCMSVHVYEPSTWNRIHWTPLIVYILLTVTVIRYKYQVLHTYIDLEIDS